MPPATANSTILTVKNLRVAFDGRTVIQNLSFDVAAGDTFAVIGPNGSGKTVLLRALLNLLPYEGEIRWSATVRLGYVPQKIAADRQLPLRARDLLEAKARFLHLPTGELDSVSAEVGLSHDLLETNTGVLSGGQFQKVLIAFALMGHPNALLFDEPTASLDELTEEHVYDSLHSLQKSQRFTMILVSHDLSVVYRYADMVICLSKTHPCAGAPRDVLTPETLEELYSAPQKYYQHRHDATKG
jgi:zinc transport system ATP-binding protein